MHYIFGFLMVLSYMQFAYASHAPINIQNGCNVNNARFVATFTPTIYNCSNGYYLPADTTECAACPSGYVCNGGTYMFNEATDQGIKIFTPFTTNVSNGCKPILVPNKIFFSTFQPSQYTCATGYYLPAHAIDCVVCPENSYCSGGTYTFNETISQGIESCPNNWYSPTGMSSVAQCGRILHVGDDVVYLRNVTKTTPSLNVKVGNDIFYGNMTTNDVVMHNGATHRLKIRFNDTTYSVYDDTVDIDE